MKKLTNTFLIFCFFAFTLSCKKEAPKWSYPPLTPMLASKSIDVNNDSINDFIIEYSTIATTDVPSSGSSTIGKLWPLNSNNLLYDKTSGYLFLQKNDTLFLNPKTNQTWFPYGADLISKSNKDTQWKISSYTPLSDYFLAFKIVVNNKTSCGWMNLEFNTSNGSINIKSKTLTDKDYIIIK